MIYSSPPLGEIGIVPDLGVNHRLPVGAWKDAKNLRFSDKHVRKIKAPTDLIDTVAADATWLELYQDDIGPRFVYGTPTKLYRLNLAGDTWDDVTNISADYQGGDWHSFPWGEAVVFNNGVDVPQILVAGTANFVDLPNWGLLTSGQQTVTAKSLRPFGTVMVACDITFNSDNKPNMVWFSGPGVIDNNDTNFNSPSWDYEDAGSLSGFNYVGVDEGPIIDSLSLANSHMIYTRSSVVTMRFVGGSNVYAFRKILGYGLANLGGVAEFKNFHFVIAPATIFIHDGSRVVQIADGRYEEAFFDNLAELDSVKCEQDVTNKEIHTLYENRNGTWEYLIYNYDENTFSKGDAFKGESNVVCMVFGLEADLSAETYDTITTTYATEQRTYADMNLQGQRRRMYWLLEDQLVLAENSTALEAEKEYFVESGRLSFDELGPQFTSDTINYMYRILPHVEGDATTRFTISRSSNLGSVQPGGERVRDFDPNADAKINFRASARYLSMRVDVVTDGKWEMLTMDYGVEVTHGR